MKTEEDDDPLLQYIRTRRVISPNDSRLFTQCVIMGNTRHVPNSSVGKENAGAWYSAKDKESNVRRAEKIS